VKTKQHKPNNIRQRCASAMLGLNSFLFLVLGSTVFGTNTVRVYVLDILGQWYAHDHMQNAEAPY